MDDEVEAPLDELEADEEIEGHLGDAASGSVEGGKDGPKLSAFCTGA